MDDDTSDKTAKAVRAPYRNPHQSDSSVDLETLRAYVEDVTGVACASRSLGFEITQVSSYLAFLLTLSAFILPLALRLLGVSSPILWLGRVTTVRGLQALFVGIFIGAFAINLLIRSFSKRAKQRRERPEEVLVPTFEKRLEEMIQRIGTKANTITMVKRSHDQTLPLRPYSTEPLQELYVRVGALRQSTLQACGSLAGLLASWRDPSCLAPDAVWESIEETVAIIRANIDTLKTLDDAIANIWPDHSLNVHERIARILETCRNLIPMSNVRVEADSTDEVVRDDAPADDAALSDANDPQEVLKRRVS